MERFLENQNLNNVVSAEFSALGTIANPFASLNVVRLSMNVVSGALTANCNAALEDHNVSVSQINAKWGLHELHDASLDLSLQNYSGEASGEYHLNFGEKSITAPLKAMFISDAPLENAGTGAKRFPASYVFTLSSSGCESPVFSRPKSFDVRAVKRPGRLDIATTGTDSIAFWLLDSGEADLKLGGALPINLHAAGSVSRNALDVSVNSINIDVSPFAAFLDFGIFAAHKGIVSGDIHIGGIL
jgi:hypothetical protein